MSQSRHYLSLRSARQFLFAVLLVGSVADATSLAQVIAARGCSTAPVAGLSHQLVYVANQTTPSLFEDLRKHGSCVDLSSSAAIVPFLQSGAVSSLCTISRARGSRVVINSAMRSLAQQLLLYKWYGMHLCGITLAAAPGNSNHESGGAVDIGDTTGWRNDFTSHGWSWQGSSDPSHYNWSAARDERKESIKAFQQLWNLNNPGSRIAEDGLYGPATEHALLASPAEGFAHVNVAAAAAAAVETPSSPLVQQYRKRA